MERKTSTMRHWSIAAVTAAKFLDPIPRCRFICDRIQANARSNAICVRARSPQKAIWKYTINGTPKLPCHSMQWTRIVRYSHKRLGAAAKALPKIFGLLTSTRKRLICGNPWRGRQKIDELNHRCQPPMNDRPHSRILQRPWNICWCRKVLCRTRRPGNRSSKSQTHRKRANCNRLATNRMVANQLNVRFAIECCRAEVHCASIIAPTPANAHLNVVSVGAPSPPRAISRRTSACISWNRSWHRCTSVRFAIVSIRMRWFCSNTSIRTLANPSKWPSIKLERRRCVTLCHCSDTANHLVRMARRLATTKIQSIRNRDDKASIKWTTRENRKQMHLMQVTCVTTEAWMRMRSGRRHDASHRQSNFATRKTDRKHSMQPNSFRNFHHYLRPVWVASDHRHCITF